MLRRRLSLALLLASLLPAIALAAPVPSASILLVAASGMKDPRFAQTVIVVTRHGRSPPIGVIVNRPTAATVGQLFPKLPATELSRPLHFGGPVATDQITFLFRSRQGSDDAIPISPNVHLGRSGVTLSRLLRGEHPHQGLLVLVGYAGWSFGQLEREIERGDWFVLPMDEKAVFEQPADTMWRDLHRRASITTVSNPHPTLHTTPDT